MTLINGRLKKPVSLLEISKCIGVKKQDLGTLVLHPNVNMWSRKKPVHNDSPAPDSNEWWKGAEKDCGIKAPKRVSSFADVRDMYDGNLNGWSYTKPERYYRQLDFDGYYHNAEPQINGLDVPEEVFMGNNIAASIGLRESDLDEDGDGSLDMQDIMVDGVSLDEWYVGIAIFDGDKLVGWKAEDKGLQAQQLEYPTTNGMLGKTYTVMPFYSKVMLPQDSGNYEEALMSVPILMPKEVEIKSVDSLLSIYVDAIWSNDKSAITFTLQVDNKGVYDRPVTSSYARLMEERVELNTPDEYWTLNLDGETEYGIDLNITDIPKDGLVQTFTQNIGSSNKDRTYVLLVRLISGGENIDYGPEVVNYEEELS
jgi:hypothetical protein